MLTLVIQLDLWRMHYLFKMKVLPIVGFAQPSVTKVSRAFLAFLLILLFGSGRYTSAQAPSHYMLGEEALAGINVYSMVQDDRANVWISTDKGLLRYNGYRFKQIPSPGIYNTSLFELKKDLDGKVYCCNLSGQILRVEQDTLRLFYTVPDSLLSDFIHFNFDDQNQLVFCSRNYYVLDSLKTPKFLFPSFLPNKIEKTPRAEPILIDEENRVMALFAQGEIQHKEPLPFQANRPYVAGNQLYLGISKSRIPQVYRQNGKSWEQLRFWSNPKFKQNEILEFNVINDSLLAFFYRTKGVSFYTSEGKYKYGIPEHFSNYRISGFLNDKEGNLWLSTLGKGILVISNPAIIDYKNHPLLKEDDLKTITSGIDGSIYLAGLKGNVYQVKNKEISVLQTTGTEVEKLAFHPTLNRLFFDRYSIRISDKTQTTTNASSVKDICFAPDEQIYYASNIGLVSMSASDLESERATVTLLTDTRCHTLDYFPVTNEIWVGTSIGLQRYSSGKIESVTYKSEPVFATDIQYINDEMWVSTGQNGVLVFNEEGEGKPFDFTLNKDITSVEQLKHDKANLYFTTPEGLYIYAWQTKEARFISMSSGLLSDRILDFEVMADTLWVVSPEGVQQIPTSALQKNTVAPTLSWKDITVNGKAVDANRFSEFSHDQNQFEFRFVATGFRHRGKLIYRYKLSGIDESWQEKGFENNSVQYASLPPGSYEFQVTASNEDAVQSDLLRYKFTIGTPFWLSWWFITLAGLGLIAFGGIYFMIRLNIVKKQLTLEKQLKISEIKAIKAQMNPHFVFNALNSIQDLILQKDVRASNIYLGKFSDLMRKTLDYSSKNFIALGDEIEMLELYLSIEKLRFGEDFSPNVICSLTEQERQDAQVPSMLIQPYVENAIKHGLMHKTGIKKLDVRFFLERNSLICEIEDNGVGREKSEAIKERQSKVYSSFSTEANKKRIDLIRESTNAQISLQVIDLKEAGKAMGTKVILRFPR
jgi:ligand-binding sensor domain-containing protein